MSDRLIARRYARSLLEEADHSGNVAAVDEDVALLRESLSAAPEFGRFLRSPILSREKKTIVIDRLLSSRLQPLTLRFVQLLIENEREGILPEIVAAYLDLRDLQQGVVEATATVAMPMPEKDRADLKQAVQQMTGKQVRLNVRHDPRLIGGIVVRVGDTVYDGSVLHQLENLRGQLQPGQMRVNGTDHRS